MSRRPGLRLVATGATYTGPSQETADSLVRRLLAGGRRPRPALVHLQRLGATRAATFSWFMATGVLVERIQDQILAFSARTGFDVVDGGHLGVSDVIAKTWPFATARPSPARCA